MLRAARVAAARNLAVRVVPLPQGADGADLVQSEGAQAMQQRVDASVPFVRFRVERELGAGDPSTAEGKDRVIDALRPVFAGIPSERDARGAVRARRRPHGPRPGARRLAARAAGARAPREPVPGAALAGIRPPASPPGRRPDPRPGRARNAPSSRGASPCRAQAARSS